jgi:hypothetical protein
LGTFFELEEEKTTEPGFEFFIEEVQAREGLQGNPKTHCCFRAENS